MKLKMGGRSIDPVRVFCIGMNYMEHIRELKNEVPKAPVVFMKPATSLVPAGGTIERPRHGHEFHYEAEVVVLIGRDGRAATPEEAAGLVGGFSLGLDLTVRDVQAQLRKAGHPWEACKAFEQSAPVGDFTPTDASIDPGNLAFTCDVNGQRKQTGNTRDMIFSIPILLVEMSKIWKFRAGDLIYTGTPPGIGALASGDMVAVGGPQLGSFSWTID